MISEQKEIKLRPRHVWGLHDIQESTGRYYHPDEYITKWREQEGEIKYTEKLILHGRNTVFYKKCKQIIGSEKQSLLFRKPFDDRFLRK